MCAARNGNVSTASGEVGHMSIWQVGFFCLNLCFSTTGQTGSHYTDWFNSVKYIPINFSYQMISAIVCNQFRFHSEPLNFNASKIIKYIAD